MSSNKKPSIGIVGGTGDLGRGLAVRLAKAGHPQRRMSVLDSGSHNRDPSAGN